MKRNAIPDSLRQLLFQEANFQCAYCGHRDGLNLTCHHIKSSGEKGETHYNNLIALCYNCHNRIHESKTINDSDIRRIKRHLVHNFLTQSGVNALKIAYNDIDGFVYAVPSLLDHLEERGLIESESIGYSAKIKISTPAINNVRYRITDEGKRLYEIWLKSK
ncbi:MAG: HNH endonuclease signature motif containing protein [Candidatus Omnitrophica bacterium]|nr:HNH endonuclease signature motif containing protein [Candidatus Omnitrophota bacterium]